MGSYSPDMVQDLRGQVKCIATRHKWLEIAWQPEIGMVSFGKFFDSGKARINVYLSTMTVATAINHPNRGKNQLYRRDVSLKALEKIFENPRTHMKKYGVRGYHNKKEIAQ